MNPRKLIAPVVGALVFLMLLFGFLTGGARPLPYLDGHVVAAYADGCDGTSPPGVGDCPSTPTPTPTPLGH